MCFRPRLRAQRPRTRTPHTRKYLKHLCLNFGDFLLPAILGGCVFLAFDSVTVDTFACVARVSPAMSASVMYSPSTSPMSPQPFPVKGAFLPDRVAAHAAALGISPTVGFAAGHATIPAALLDAYRSLAAGFGSSARAMGYGANIPDPASSPQRCVARAASPRGTPTAMNVQGASPPALAVHLVTRPVAGPQSRSAPASPARGDTLLEPGAALRGLARAQSVPALSSACPPSPLAARAPFGDRSNTPVAVSTCPSPQPASPAARPPTPLTQVPTPLPTPATPAATAPAALTTPAVLTTPAPLTTPRRVLWADFQGGALEAATTFMRDDEPWRCARAAAGKGHTRSPLSGMVWCVLSCRCVSLFEY